MDFNDKYSQKSFFEINLHKGEGGVGIFKIKTANIKFFNLVTKQIEEKKVDLNFPMLEEDINFFKKFISNLNLIIEKKIFAPEGKITISSDKFFNLDKRTLFNKNHISEVFKSPEMNDLLNIIKRNIIHTEFNLDELTLFEENLKQLEVPNRNLSEAFFIAGVHAGYIEKGTWNKE